MKVADINKLIGTLLQEKEKLWNDKDMPTEIAIELSKTLDECIENARQPLIAKTKVPE